MTVGHKWFIERRSRNFNYWACRRCNRNPVKHVSGFGTPDFTSITQEQCNEDL